MATRSANEATPDRISHPGRLLAEEIEARGMSQRELATRMGRPAQVINAIVRGHKRITAETALDIEDALGIAASTWVNLQARYDLVTALNERRQRQAG